ncbi:hypothetical protein OAR07_01110 [Flavobacteriaceae bacterium]|nr:hypothetical protein [Flavobacteriaceae bacterium]
MNTTEITPRQKFQNYFNLKDGFYIDDAQIDGECTHEGQEVKFTLYIYDEDSIFDFDEKYFEKNEYNHNPNRIDGWIEYCIIYGIGFDLDIDYDGDHEFKWDINDYILNEGIYNYFLPYVPMEFYTTHLEEVA